MNRHLTQLKRIIIAGSRTFNNYQFMYDRLREVVHTTSEWHRWEIVSGGAKGADSLGERFANENSLNLTVFPADWNTHGRSAGFIRNKQMAEYGDVLYAFWDGASPGTKNMVKQALESRVEIHLYLPGFTSFDA